MTLITELYISDMALKYNIKVNLLIDQGLKFILYRGQNDNMKACTADDNDNNNVATDDKIV